jgi:radical SAM/Cys-rich protein
LTTPTFAERLQTAGFGELRRERLDTLQINLGRYCNQACLHCHVEAGPHRTERMEARTAERIFELLLESPQIETVDLTGGAPELHEVFRPLVLGARSLGIQVIDRCNLTCLFVDGQEDLAPFLQTNRVHVVASLPCYTQVNVDRQRGTGVFDQSIQGLQLLNALGYGQVGSGLELDLVFNPLGPTLPPSQAALEADYRIRLEADFGITFNHLLTVTNMPIKRFSDQLRRLGQEETYASLLETSFNPNALPHLMCRNLLSIGYDGRIYDCDFNQMLDLPAEGARDIWSIHDFEELERSRITTGRHCFGCTAGCGSSCGGALL